MERTDGNVLIIKLQTVCLLVWMTVIKMTITPYSTISVTGSTALLIYYWIYNTIF